MRFEYVDLTEKFKKLYYNLITRNYLKGIDVPLAHQIIYGLDSICLKFQETYLFLHHAW